jgi:thioredoxin-related protein
MKKILILLTLITISFQVKAVDFYKGTYSEALKEAEKTNKLILLYFTAKWCGPCQYMSKYILTDTEIQHKISKNYIALKLDVDIDVNKQIYYKYNADKGISIPKFFFVNSKEEVIKSHIGSLKLNQFKKFLDIPEFDKPISKAESDSIAQIRVNSNVIKPSAFNEFMYNASNSRWKPGVRLGTNYHGIESSGTSIDYDKGKLGFNFTLFLDYTTERFLFQPGIAFYSKGAKTSNPSETLKLNYLEIPLRVSINTFKCEIFSCRQSVRLNIEPYGAYALSGKFENSNIQFGSTNGKLDRFDYGIKTGISLQMGSFEPSIGYDFGLNNLSNEKGENIFNRGFYLNFALIFGK